MIEFNFLDMLCSKPQYHLITITCTNLVFFQTDLDVLGIRKKFCVYGLGNFSKNFIAQKFGRSQNFFLIFSDSEGLWPPPHGTKKDPLYGNLGVLNRFMSSNYWCPLLKIPNKNFWVATWRKKIFWSRFWRKNGGSVGKLETQNLFFYASDE